MIIPSLIDNKSNSIWPIYTALHNPHTNGTNKHTKGNIILRDRLVGHRILIIMKSRRNYANKVVKTERNCFSIITRKAHNEGWKEVTDKISANLGI